MRIKEGFHGDIMGIHISMLVWHQLELETPEQHVTIHLNSPEILAMRLLSFTILSQKKHQLCESIGPSQVDTAAATADSQASVNMETAILRCWQEVNQLTHRSHGKVASSRKRPKEMGFHRWFPRRDDEFLTRRRQCVCV